MAILFKPHLEAIRELIEDAEDVSGGRIGPRVVRVEAGVDSLGPATIDFFIQSLATDPRFEAVPIQAAGQRRPRTVVVELDCSGDTSIGTTRLSELLHLGSEAPGLNAWADNLRDLSELLGLRSVRAAVDTFLQYASFPAAVAAITSGSPLIGGTALLGFARYIQDRLDDRREPIDAGLLGLSATSPQARAEAIGRILAELSESIFIVLILRNADRGALLELGLINGLCHSSTGRVLVVLETSSEWKKAPRGMLDGRFRDQHGAAVDRRIVVAPLTINEAMREISEKHRGTTALVIRSILQQIESWQHLSNVFESRLSEACLGRPLSISVDAIPLLTGTSTAAFPPGHSGRLLSALAVSTGQFFAYPHVERLALVLQAPGSDAFYLEAAEWIARCSDGVFRFRSEHTHARALQAAYFNLTECERELIRSTSSIVASELRVDSPPPVVDLVLRLAIDAQDLPRSAKNNYTWILAKRYAAVGRLEDAIELIEAVTTAEELGYSENLLANAWRRALGRKPSSPQSMRYEPNAKTRRQQAIDAALAAITVLETDPELARTETERLADLLRATDPLQWSDLWCTLAHLYANMGAGHKAAQVLTRVRLARGGTEIAWQDLRPRYRSRGSGGSLERSLLAIAAARHYAPRTGLLAGLLIEVGASLLGGGMARSSIALFDEAKAILEECPSSNDQDLLEYFYSLACDELGDTRGALTMIDRLCSKSDGATYLVARHARASFLSKIGQNQQALFEVDQVIGLQSEHPRIGRHHPSTLACRNYRASYLDELGRTSEALDEITEVINLQTHHEEVGPNHRNTITSRHDRATYFSKLGRTQRALDEINVVVDLLSQHPDIGPRHPSTFACRNDRAGYLAELGRTRDALDEINDVIDLETQHEDIGPNHPSALTSRHNRADYLYSLGRTQDALNEIDELIDLQTQHPDLGPNHPHTLISRHDRAGYLDKLGKTDDALAEIDDVIRLKAQHPDIGPRHPSTLTSRQDRVGYLTNYGHVQLALEEVERLIDAQLHHPDIGPIHPSTLLSRYRRAVCNFALQRKAQALTELTAVVRSQSAHPDLGPNHPLTLESINLRRRVRKTLVNRHH